MRLSQSFGKTLRDAPADAEMISHQLLIRGNFVRPAGAGIYTFHAPWLSRTAQDLADYGRGDGRHRWSGNVDAQFASRILVAGDRTLG